MAVQHEPSVSQQQQFRKGDIERHIGQPDSEICPCAFEPIPPK